MMLKTVFAIFIAAFLALGPGCAEYGSAQPKRPVPPPLADEPIGLQLTRAEPRLAGESFRVLLDFEKPHDSAFLLAPLRPTIDPGNAHTGRSSLLLNPQIREFAVKLGALSPGPFPGSWTLAGAYFRSAGPATITLSWRTASGIQPAGQREVTLAPNQWTPVLLDLTTASTQTSADAGVLVFKVAGSAMVWCDDVVLINNDRVLDAPARSANSATANSAISGSSAANSAEPQWTIRRRGLQTIVDQPGRFRLTLKTSEGAEDGWNCVEACELRACFVSATGRNWTIYSDGRQVLDGKLEMVYRNVDPAIRITLAEQHAEPGELEVAEEFGRVNRETAGDRNNDGYNELRGAYQLSANGCRFEARLIPKTRAIVKPIIEIAGLPRGAAIVTVEGQLIERHVRLPDGRLLVQIPLTIERAATINVSVKK